MALSPVLPHSLVKITPRRLLIVEDHESTAAVMQKLLQRHGHEVWVALSYQEAMGIVRNYSIEVIICDLKLPDGDGCDLLREVQSHQPVFGIVMSGLSSAEDKQRTREAGFAVHLVKPFDITEIETHLIKLFV